MTENANFRLFNPPAIHQPTGYSQVAEVSGGKTIYISGQIALDPSGTLVGEGDVKAQAEQVFANINSALAAVGADFNAVIKLGFFLIDITQLVVVREVRDRYVDRANPPTSTAVEVRRLARDGLLIEVEAVAVVSA